MKRHTQWSHTTLTYTSWLDGSTLDYTGIHDSRLRWESRRSPPIIVVPIVGVIIVARVIFRWWEVFPSATRSWRWWSIGVGVTGWSSIITNRVIMIWWAILMEGVIGVGTPRVVVDGTRICSASGARGLQIRIICVDKSWSESLG